MKYSNKKVLKLSISIYALLHFLSYFFEAKILVMLMALSGSLLFIFAGMSRSVKKFKLPVFLMLSGITVLILSETSFLDGLYHGLLVMRDIIGLLVIIPMIGWVLNAEPYIESVMRYAYKMINTSRKFYFGITTFTQIISYFLLFGAIPMMYHFVNKMVGSGHGEALEKFKATALLRSFALSTIWVVSIPSFIFAVDALRASLWLAILQGLFISICGIIVAVIFSHFEEKKYGVNLTTVIKGEMEQVIEESSDDELGRDKVVGFSLLFVTLFGSIFLLHAVWPIDLLVIIPLVIIVWAVLYFVIQKRTARLFRESKEYFSKGIEGQAYQLSTMLGAGVLIFSLNQTGLGNFVVSGVYHIQDTIPALNILYFLPFIVILLGFTGLGPLTVMVLVAGILENIALPYPPELTLIAITSGSVISILLSPVLMPVIVLSGSNGLSGLKNGIGFNLSFAIIFYCLVQVYVQTMIHFW